MGKFWTSLLLVATTQSALGFPPRDSCWSVDKETLRAGGCLTIVVQKACSDLPKLHLQIDEDEPLRLLDAGPDYQDRNSPLPGRDTTLVMLFWDIVNPESVAEAPGRTGEFTWLPVFNEPGAVRLTLWSGDESLGAIDVTVLPATRQSNEAMALLAPRLAPKKKPPHGEVTWMSLFIDRSLGVTPPVDAAEVARLREQLPIIAQHPDWAEIAEMFLARLEARVYGGEVTEPERGELRERVNRVELPELVTRNLDRNVKSPFAEAVQDDLRDIVGQLRVAERKRSRERESDR